MNDIDRWFEHTGRRENRAVSLYTSLLTGRIGAYFRYRLRFSLLLATARFAVHVIEFLILISTLGGTAAFTVMVLRIGSLVVGGGWWGLLEVMRERLRAFSQAGERDAAEHEIGRWLVLAVIAAVMLTIVGGVGLAVLQPSGHNPVGHVYAFLIVLEVAIGFPVKVIHSGVYATRRVYRPIWSMFAPTLAQLGVLSVGSYLYPTAAIIIAIIAANAIGISITVHYTLEVYRLTGLWPRFEPPTHHFWAFWRLLPKIPPWLGLQTTLSGFALRFDGILVLALVGVYGTSARSFDLTAGAAAWRHVDAFQFFYLVLPLFRGTYEAAGLFYFDFVRLRGLPALSEFRIFFFHRNLWMAPVIAVYFWSLAAALGLFVLHDIPLSFLLALLPLFVVRSAIGIYQIRLFAEGRFGAHLGSFAFLIALLGLVWIDSNPASDLLEITAAMITQLIVLINLQHFHDRRQPPVPTLLPLGDWIRELAREPGPVRVGCITIAESITPKQRSATMTLMRQKFGDKGHFAFRTPTALIYYERSANRDTEQQPHLTLQAITGGTANHGNFLPAVMTNGRDALDRLIADEWIQPVDDALVRPDSLETLSSEFRALFADGIVFDLETHEGSRDMRSLEPGVLAQALPTAITGLEGGTAVVPVDGRLLTPLYHEGRLRLLFLLPPDPDAAVFKNWLHTVKAWHIVWGTTEAAECARNG
ncbi:hypothetical protein [Mycobacterium spongiae]|uniref:Uncharacterized protein n=1 Tax=Mycobacterium spongiae TaxID=886343 RepID=A0A975JU42_9MYCO|nr:hypothetical protein [Mycobacterium spongiae]QUR65732.1 hypothetical protein F6B93_00360 [Mycobacterium spongiae]